MSNSAGRAPSFFDVGVAVVVLLMLLATSVFLFGDESSEGANQIALLISSVVAILIGVKNGFNWREISQAIAQGVASIFGAILIIFTVGVLIGSLILSGTVPAMIYYGLQIVSPSIFYFTACILCAIAAVSIGSSWSVAGTIGIGLMGIAAGQGLDPAITAGAIISGAYFGDKMSPLSDTTNLAPAVSGTDLFVHIRHMTWTTFPSIGLALTLYLIIGLMTDVSSQQIDLGERLRLLDENFEINFFLFLPLVAIFFMAVKKYPAFPSLLGGALVAAMIAVIFQQDVILKFVNAPEKSDFVNIISGIWTAMFAGFSADTGNDEINNLLTRGGLNDMSNTVSLVLCAITYGSVLEKLGILNKLVMGMIEMAKTTGSLVLVTALTCFGLNVMTADQYIAIVLPGRIFRLEYRKRKLAAKNLSRAIEDTATVTSVLVPWNTCGAYFSGTLGIATFAYLPFCFFNWISPIISVLYGMYNIKISPIVEEEVLAE